MTDQHDERFLLLRGVKRRNPLAITIFIGLRGLDVALQYGILAKGLANPLLNAMSIYPSTPTVFSGVALGLPLKSLILLGMATGTVLKHWFWVTSISNEFMPTVAAFQLSLPNAILNSLNSIISVTAASSYFTPPALHNSNATGLSPLSLLGIAAYVLGTTLEVTSEIQRKRFKADSKNSGKPYTGGLFGLARHINYGGYVLMRGGYALTAGGWIWGTVMGVFFFSDLATRAVPELDGYCTKRYGASWAAFKQKVPYRLFPGVY